MVRDRNNFPEARAALTDGLGAGLIELHSETLNRVLSNMAEGKDALGRAWKPVEPATLRSREVRKSDPRPLVDTGEFRGDIAATSEVDLSAMAAVIGTTKIYGPVHEFGAPEMGIPRRPIFGPAGIYAENIAEETFGEAIDTRLTVAEI